MPGKLSNHFLLLSIFVLMVLTGGLVARLLSGEEIISGPPALVLISAYDSVPTDIFFSRASSSVSFPRRRESIPLIIPTSSTGDCSAVFPLARYLLKSDSRPRAALEYLIQNKLTDRERATGYQSNFPDGARLNSLDIKDGSAFISLSGNFSELSPCRLSALRSQLEFTLLQFPEIKSVSVILLS